jgi:DNA gyrase subunit A
MGRNTGGVTGMRFRDGDELLAMTRVRGDRDGDVYLVTVTDGGYAKRTSVAEYRVQGRGGTGIRAARLDGDRGALVGAYVGSERDEVLVVMAAGKVVRTPVSEVPAKGRATMGVILAKPDNGDSIVAVARNPEPVDEEVDEEVQALAAATGVAVPEGDDAADAAAISGDDEAVASADETDESSAGPGDEGTSV